MKKFLAMFGELYIPDQPSLRGDLLGLKNTKDFQMYKAKKMQTLFLILLFFKFC
jgi:hypothetical protein